MNEIIPPEYREILEKLGCTETELAEIKRFAEPFCKTGRIYLFRLFQNARSCKRLHATIMEVCHLFWEKNWKHSTPGQIGDVNDVTPGGVGMRNANGFYFAHQRLGIDIRCLY